MKEIGHILYVNLIRFENFECKNFQGESNLFEIMNSNFMGFYCFLSRVMTFSAFILDLYNSKFEISQSNFTNFYPQIFHGSNSVFNISYCNFSESYQKFGFYEVRAILFDRNVTFGIINCNFKSLKNLVYGPVTSCF